MGILAVIETSVVLGLAACLQMVLAEFFNGMVVSWGRNDATISRTASLA